jgi:hypothetical protein
MKRPLFRALTGWSRRGAQLFTTGRKRGAWVSFMHRFGAGNGEGTGMNRRRVSRMMSMSGGVESESQKVNLPRQTPQVILEIS